ncbi:MAG: adenylate/guanylate cyclase domain-containing protein [Bacteriovoracaceae bacterium]
MSTEKTGRKISFPLALKLVGLTSLLVMTVAGLIAWKNSQLFSQISSDREEANVEMITSSKALEVEAILESYFEKMAVFAFDEKGRVMGPDVAYFKLESTNPLAKAERANSNVSDEVVSEFRQYVSTLKAQSALVQQGQWYVASTGKSMKSPYLVVGSPVFRENGNVTHWAWGFFKLDRLQSSFTKSGELKLYLLDVNGKVIVHSDEARTLKAEDLSGNKVIASFFKEQIRQKQQYQDEKLFSSSKTSIGPMVVVEVPQATILAPAVLARNTSFFILGIILSLSFFFTVVFSHSISRNIEKLTEFAHRIAEGDFLVNVSAEIKSKDELGVLANAFDDMTVGLLERDKIKGMFTKFHGTTITQELLNQEDVKKGNRCEAVVFFSDIRGFTDFSNDKSPEEVVAMLNSYFEVMVDVIIRHGGVVDKFVGDAIMAIWGAPNGSLDDAKMAVLACLEMRRELERLNAERIANGEQPLMIGMGLHTGPVVAGTVGSNDRLEYTVIGDTVNTASRIESATKSFGTDLLVSEAVVRKLDEEFLVELAGHTKVKGKDKTLALAKVHGYYDSDGCARIIKTAYSEYDPEESDKVKIVG